MSTLLNVGYNKATPQTHSNQPRPEKTSADSGLSGSDWEGVCLKSVSQDPAEGDS